LVGGPPGVKLHTVVDGLPSGDTGDVVPVALPTNGEAMVPNTVPGIIAAVLAAIGAETVAGTVVGAGTDATVATGGGAAGEDDAAGTVEPAKSVKNDVAGVADSESGAVELAAVGVGEVEVAGTVGVVGAANVEGGVPVVPPTADMEVTGTVGVPGAICPVGVEQVTTVPGVVGSEASGTGASVVSGLPGCVVAENGLGPLSGDVTIVPGVDARPIAVEPMVETCARPAWQPASRMAVVNSRCRIDIPPSVPV
jgi:hypothetical protein